ncbi:MAG: hypothetical protein HY659_08620 [Rhizobiales bacterium]|nr:hypothetical protein [Hyphomicrobiales bacterium]
MLLLQPATAQTAAPENDDGRFTFNRVADGFLRLDTRTGQVSLCSRRPAGWACETIPDERTALENEIARLQSNNGVLKKELLANGLSLPGSVKAPPPAGIDEKNELTLRLPSNADIDRMMAVVEKVWRRLVEMIGNLQKDVLRKT